MPRLRAIVVLLSLFLPALAGRARADDFFQQSPGPLSGSHAELDGQDNCQKCHTTGKELSLEKCLECHKDQKSRIDAGRGFHSSAKVKGKDCWSCHLEHKGKNWDEMGWVALGGQDKFDHNLTDFALHGKHSAIKCESCHTRTNKAGIRLYLGEATLCGSCHAKDQPHRFVPKETEMMKCDRCHSDVSWQPPKRVLDFNHDDKKQSAFPLEGNHLDVACAKCHPKSEFHLATDVATCAGCHPNPHKGQLFEKKPCDTCHSPKFATLAKFTFDHDRQTKFKLEGKHATLVCASCHPAGSAKKPERSCESCHAKDNKHKDRFAEFGAPAPACATCHLQTNWKTIQFNHNKQTHFVLTAKHATVECRACHRGSTPADWERFDAKTVGCMGCHQHEKVHDKKFKDTDCLGCHKTPGNIEAPKGAEEKFHGVNSRFPLTGAHAKVSCDKCHKGNQWKGLSLNCGPACHEDSLHKGSLGKDCSSCHDGGRWEAVKFDHQKMGRYPLVGQHVKVACISCHPARAFVPTPMNCADAGCHQKDDVHKGALGKQCEKCHRETGDNQFNHNTMSTFKLESAHLSVPCASCHPTMAFKPRPKDCFGCHPEPPVHKGKFGTDCASCHNTIDWKKSAPIHDVGDFSLGGAHDGVPCERCHGKELRPLAGTGPLCITCHRQDDIHSGSLGAKCGQCHTQRAFAPARFNHMSVGCNLRGTHRVLACFDCHKAGNFGGLSPACFGCHRDDALIAGNKTTTPHFGLFDCGVCHSTNYWDRAPIPVPGSSSVCR